jgi:hypothetical protein
MYQHPSDWHNNTGVIRQAEDDDPLGKVGQSSSPTRIEE